MKTISCCDHDADGFWCVKQRLATDDGFPFLVNLVDVQVCIDYTTAHHQCCWTRAVFHPVWAKFQAELLTVETAKSELTDASSPRLSKGNALPVSAPLARNVLVELAHALSNLVERQRKQRPPCGSVNRVRYVDVPPPVLRLGKGISGKCTFTISLRRCAVTGEASFALFPTFLAVEPCGAIAPFLTISVLEARRRTSTCKRALLLLQHISPEDDVAVYSNFDVELQLGASSVLPADPHAVQWAFRVYAAFYSSVESQVYLDKPFMHLHDWKPNVTRVERFAVVNPNMDPEVAFCAEKRQRANMERRIRLAISRLDDAGEAEGVDVSLPSSFFPSGATLRHVATLQTSHCVVMESCTLPGSDTLSAVMPKDTKWPLELILTDVSNRTWRSSPIAGSSSLERLAREVSRLEERVAVELDAEQ